MQTITNYSNMSELLFDLTLILFFVSLICSAVVKGRFKKYSKSITFNGLTGARAAERILRANGIYDVEIREVSGVLTDNYNPANKTLNLSQGVYGSPTVSAVAVAAHECGHAIQHATSYPLLMLRKALVPICNIGSMGSYIVILLGVLFAREELLDIGAALFSAIVLFNLVTLPVEINASRRALTQINDLNLLTEEETRGGRRVLRAAAMTYFVSLMASIVQLLRILMLSKSRRR